MSECPICFEVMKNDSNKIKTECGHEFHSNCFLSNVAYNGFNCPCCRNELASTSCLYEMSDDDDDVTISDDNNNDVTISDDESDDVTISDDESDSSEELSMYYALNKLIMMNNILCLKTIIIDLKRIMILCLSILITILYLFTCVVIFITLFLTNCYDRNIIEKNNINKRMIYAEAMAVYNDLKELSHDIVAS